MVRGSRALATARTGPASIPHPIEGVGAREGRPEEMSLVDRRFLICIRLASLLHFGLNRLFVPFFLTGKSGGNSYCYGRTGARSMFTRSH